MGKAEVLRKAEFNPKIKTYLLIFGAIVMVCTIVGIILLPVYFAIAPYLIKRHYNRLSAELTTRALRFEKGILLHVERTIPLDKIQDLTFKEGPLLRYFGLSILKVETAGSSAQAQADLTLVGIIDATDFRKRVLEQRDEVTENRYGRGDSEEDQAVVKILEDIRDSLQSIEKKMDK